jgi:predicted enzyme related to lactoylglutathione lyase
MTAELDLLLNQYNGGQLNRRQVLQGLALAAGGVLAGDAAEAQTSGSALAPAMSINYVNLIVSDVKRSAVFYASVIGAKPQESGPKIQTMSLPGAQKGLGSWLSIDAVGAESADGAGDKAGVISHVGYGVTNPASDFPRIAAEIKKRFPNVKPPTTWVSERGQEIMIFDPDGVPFQLIQVDNNGTLGKNSTAGNVIVPEEAPLVNAMSINHAQISGLKDFKRTMEFYSFVIGAKAKDSMGEPHSLTVSLPGSKPERGYWLSLSSSAGFAGGAAKANYDHIGYGVTFTPCDSSTIRRQTTYDACTEYPRIAEGIRERFPDVKPVHLFVSLQDGFECYIYDPDSIGVQLITIHHEGVNMLPGHAYTPPI